MNMTVKRIVRDDRRQTNCKRGKVKVNSNMEIKEGGRDGDGMALATSLN